MVPTLLPPILHFSIVLHICHVHDAYRLSSRAIGASKPIVARMIQQKIVEMIFWLPVLA